MSAYGSAQLPKTGDVIAGKYALERLLGQGGMGAVYAARHSKLGHPVAIKVMLAEKNNDEAARRFLQEGSAAANIQNEHVARVFDIDTENDYLYMILELLEGEDLAQVLDREGRLAPHIAVGYVLEALEGVRQAHGCGIVHRDLKPSNLFLARRPDGSVVVKVLDFGISKANSTNALAMTPSQRTSTKAMLGSPLYMSPEQLRSSKSVDARADIWAMGVVLFELVTGTVPFAGENLGELFAAILETDASPLRSKVPDAPVGLEAVINRCLQRRPEHRFQTVAELEAALRPFASAALNASASPHAYTAMLLAPKAGLAAATGPARSPTDPGMAGASQSQSHGALQPPVVHGTVPLGAISQQQQHALQQHVHQAQHQQQQTGSAWQSTGSETRPKGVSIGLVIGMISAAIVLLSGGIAGIILYKAKHDDTAATRAAASAGVSSTAPSAATSLPSGAPVASSDPPPATSTAATAPSSSTVLTAASSASLPVGAVGGGGGAGGAPPPKHHGGPTPPVTKADPPPVAKNDPPPVAKVDPPPVVKADPPKVVAHPPPAAPAGPLQGNR